MAEPFEEPSRVRTLRAVLPVMVRHDLAVELPEPIRWALSLNEGGLLMAELEELGTLRVYFRSYERLLRIAVEGCAEPWPYIQEALERPLGRIVAGGALELPEEIAQRLGHPKPGDRLLLRAGSEPSDRWLTLERDEESRAFPELYVEANYPLRVEAGDRVFPPADVLRFLSDPSEAFRIPPFLRGCAWVRLSVELSEKGVELHWDAYAQIDRN
jgi:hypothetical protein